MGVQLQKIFVYFLSVIIYFALVVVSIDYKVTVKTGRGLLAGTDANFRLTMNDCNESRNVFEINGYGKMLERNSEDIFTLEGSRDFSTFDHIIVQRISSYSIFDGWFLAWIKIDVDGLVYYATVNKWLNDNSPHTYQLLLAACMERNKKCATVYE